MVFPNGKKCGERNDMWKRMLVDHRFANLRSTVFVGIGQHVHDLEKTDRKVGDR